MFFLFVPFLPDLLSSFHNGQYRYWLRYSWYWCNCFFTGHKKTDEQSYFKNFFIAFILMMILFCYVLNHYMLMQIFPKYSPASKYRSASFVSSNGNTLSIKGINLFFLKRGSYFQTVVLNQPPHPATFICSIYLLHCSCSNL